MLPEACKAIARLVDEAINQKNLTLLFRAFPDLSSTIEQQTVEGAWVTTRSTQRGTHTGAFMGVAPTGKTIEIMHISLDQVVEGKVVEHFGVSDWLRALIAFEIVTAPAPVTTTTAGYHPPAMPCATRVWPRRVRNRVAWYCQVVWTNT